MDILFTLLGGLGLFLYGMNAMSKGFQRIAGARLKGLLRTLTTNRFMGVLSGTVATAIVQSSSVTTVMIVGFVNAGLIALPQAISVILGAHIGTTITAQIIAFEIHQVSLPLLALGALLNLFGRSESFKNIGSVLFGFGALFFGLQLMTSAFDPLRENETVHGILRSFSIHPLLGVLAGMFLTVVVQSSSVTTGITIALALASLITFEQAVPLILGENIGTTVTANLAAIAGSYAAKQAARAHFIVNATGTLLILILITPFIKLVLAVSPGTDIARQIANTHTAFNISTTILFLPFINFIAQITKFLIYGKKREAELAYLEEASLEDPATALDQTKTALRETYSQALHGLTILANAVPRVREREIDILKEIRERLERYQSRITEYLEKIPSKNISKEQLNLLPRFVRTIHEIERIKDYEEKMKDVIIHMLGEGRTFHSMERSELRNYFNDVVDLMRATGDFLKNGDIKQAHRILSRYEAIYEKKDALRTKSRKRFEMKHTGIAIANYYYDIITSLEEIAKKCRNIVKALVEA